MSAYAIVKRLSFIFIIWLSFNSLNASGGAFRVKNPVVYQIGNGYVINAIIEYPLTPRVIEAIENGVPVTFYQEFKLIKSYPILGKYWQWKTTLWEPKLSYELRYHALSRQYVLRALDTETQYNYPTLDGALQALGQVKALNLPPEHTSKTKNLILEIRSGIDINALPTPMRPGALISEKWQLDSPWVQAIWL